MFFVLRSGIALLIGCLAFVDGLSQKTYVLDDTTFAHRLDTYVEYFIDSASRYTIEDVTSPDDKDLFKPSTKNLTFGYLKSPLWIKVTTKNAKPNNQWYLIIPAPFLEYVDFYQRVDSTWQHSQAGYFRPQSIRKFAHTNHVLPLVFSTDSSSTVLIKITGQSPKTFPVLAAENEFLDASVRWEDLGYGVFFGILVVMFFYNLFIYLTLKQGNFLLYICTIVCTFLIFGSASGYAGKFLWPEHPMLNFYAGRMSLGVLTVFLSIFTIRFLEVKTYSKVMYYALVALVPLGIISMILVATGIMSSAGNNLISVSTIVYMTTGIVCRVKGNRTADYFIAAWTFYLCGGLLLTLRNSGVLDYNFWTTHFVEIGATMETVIIAFALGDRYRKYKIEKEEAQALALRIQKEATEKLELKVQERTEQLSKAYEELRSTLETNTLQTKIIENKNAELDAFFYRISHDLKGPISTLLGLSFLAQKDLKDEQALDYMARQHQQVERLNTIITGLIKLTRLNHTDLLKEKIDFQKMVDDCVVSLNGVPNYPKVSFRKEIDHSIAFYSEWALLNAVIQNLIENAIKYSTDDSPYVHIIVRSEATLVVIEVRDNGQGIPEEHQPKIFEMFYRASHHAEGTGLGLYILKRSVDRLKGQIHVESKVGKGSTFTIKLPLH